MVAVDVDVDDPRRAGLIEARVLEIGGATAVRRRGNSSRIAMLYGSDPDDPPHSHTLAGAHGRIDVLGDRRQLASFGMHRSGAELYWAPIGPLDIALAALPRISTAQMSTLLAACAPVIGVSAGEAVPRPVRSAAATSASLACVASALMHVPADDYGVWVKLGAALHRAFGGSAEALAVFDGWSATSKKYRNSEIGRRWASFGEGCPIRQANIGTILFYAHKHGWRSPPPEPDAGWLAAHPPVGGISPEGVR
jgi:hypothetical protein